MTAIRNLNVSLTKHGAHRVATLLKQFKQRMQTDAFLRQPLVR